MASHEINPTIYAPNKIYIQPEPKKDKSPPPGAFLYNDIFNCYRGFEHLYLLSKSPVAYAAGLATGTFVGAIKYVNNGAPKKIAQDGEMIDFGSKVHSSGFIQMMNIFAKRFFLGIYPAANIDKFGQWAAKDVQDVSNITAGLKHAFIVYKAAQLSEEVVQRLANWADVPAK
ncbi:MAG: hypothetical protein S4CHLAM6_01990 [Chlamydiae bacterium]|nr:hypothetical protein [Chlamydiota bacterium]